MQTLLKTLFVALAVTAVTTPSMAQVAPAKPAWTVDSVLRISSKESGKALGPVRGIARGADGRIYAADGSDNQIHIYDSNGRIVSSAAGSGSATGKFTTIGSVGFVHDTLYAIDARTGLVNFYDANGAPIGHLDLQLDLNIPGLDAAVASKLLPDGSVILRSNGGVMSLNGMAPHPVLRASRSGTNAKTLASIDVNSSTIAIARDGGGAMFTTNPFPMIASASIDPSSARMAVVTPNEPANLAAGQYRVTMLSLNGDTVWSRVFDTPPREVSKSEVDSIVAAMTSHSQSSLTEAELRMNMYVPKWRPSAERALFDGNGTLWVKTAVRVGTDAEWNLIDRNGTVASKVMMPARFEPREINGDDILGTEGNNLSSTIVSYRVRKTPRIVQ